jgi:hypothetical protein
VIVPGQGGTDVLLPQSSSHPDPICSEYDMASDPSLESAFLRSVISRNERLQVSDMLYCDTMQWLP